MAQAQSAGVRTKLKIPYCKLWTKFFLSLIYGHKSKEKKKQRSEAYSMDRADEVSTKIFERYFMN